MGVRRVVTGHNAEGKAIFASDEIVEPVTLEMLPGAEWFTLWGGDEAPTFPDDGSMPEHTTYFPPLGGFRFGIFTVQPETEDSFLPENFDLEAALAEDIRAVMVIELFEVFGFVARLIRAFRIAHAEAGCNNAAS